MPPFERDFTVSATNSSEVPFGDFVIRRFDPARDLQNVLRVWRECGWIRQDSDETYTEHYYSIGDAYVGTLDGSAESACHVLPGFVRYQDEDLQLAGIACVVTSRIARKQGLGKATTAFAISNAKANGAEIAILNAFEQGFYDNLGFGSGTYEQIIAFSPADLKKGEHRIPRRLSKEDWPGIYGAMKNRWLSHGGCVLDTPEFYKPHTGWRPNGFGLGYYNDQDELTHFFYGAMDAKHGPLQISAMGYQNGQQLRELFSLIRSLGDQIDSVVLIEPPHIQLQDLMSQPFRLRRLSEGSTVENAHRASAFWQARILDLDACLRKTHLAGADLKFNLTLTDPIAEFLPDANSWNGLAGDYTVTLGEESSSTSGSDAKLPTLRATVNAFTRLWLGVRPATEVTITDELHGDDSLLQELDAIFRLPAAKLGWYF